MTDKLQGRQKDLAMAVLGAGMARLFALRFKKLTGIDPCKTGFTFGMTNQEEDELNKLEDIWENIGPEKRTRLMNMMVFIGDQMTFAETVRLVK
jgi:hypothetical protein